ncbi:MAG TPA: prepilin peptidase [Gammaproteobacteria bacterium]|nr:prepilin peptidase [Gammaproteobacteria bacterium]
MFAEAVLSLFESNVVLISSISLLGLFFGSFLNVVIYRIPLRLQHEWRTECKEFLEIESSSTDNQETAPPENIFTSRSHCPRCGHLITALENIPVLSYLLLRGKCSECSTRISPRYPAIEILTAILSGLVAWSFGLTPALPFLLILVWSLIALSFIDFDHKLLPDTLLLPILWLGLLVNSQGLITDIHSSLYGAVAGYLSLWLFYQAFKLLTGKEGMGYGDFKLLALIGAWLGWQMLPLVILLSSLVGAVTGILGILILGRNRQLPIPFGPYLSIAGLIALFWGQEIIDGYLQFAGLQ